MAELFASGVIVDLILLLIAVEAALLYALTRWIGRGPSLAELLPNLLAGAFLLLALRAVITGAEWKWTAACLAAALVAHLADLRSRWTR